MVLQKLHISSKNEYCIFASLTRKREKLSYYIRITCLIGVQFLNFNPSVVRGKRNVGKPGSVYYFTFLKISIILLERNFVYLLNKLYISAFLEDFQKIPRKSPGVSLNLYNANLLLLRCKLF